MFTYIFSIYEVSCSAKQVLVYEKCSKAHLTELEVPVNVIAQTRMKSTTELVATSKRGQKWPRRRPLLSV